MYYSEKILEKSFKNKISKQAYLDACKWLAVNVYGKAELSKLITVSVLKQPTKKEQLPTFTVSLYLQRDEEGELHEYCHKCRQLHSLLYSIDRPDCNMCKLNCFKKIKHGNMESVKKTVGEIFDEENN